LAVLSKKCAFCGLEADRDVRLCPSCGRPFDERMAQTPTGAEGLAQVDFDQAEQHDVTAETVAPSAPRGTAAPAVRGAGQGMHGGLDYVDFGEDDGSGLELDLDATQELVIEQEEEQPIYGREQQIEQICYVLDYCKQGVAQTSLLIGEEGQGKSRLLREAERLASERGFATAMARGARFGVPLVLDLFRQWVIALCNAMSDKPRPAPRLQLCKIQEALAWPGEQRLPASLARRLEQLFSGRVCEPVVDLLEHRERMEATLFYFIWIAAQHSPLCLLIDDAQRADPESLRLLRGMIARLPDSRLGILAAGGAGVESLLPSGATLIELTPLDVKAAMRIAADRLPVGNLPAGVGQILMAGTGGNPLLIRQQVQVLVEQRVMQLNKGNWALAKTQQQHIVSEPKHYTLQRAAQLSPEALYVTRVAAVAGELVVIALISAACSPRGVDTREALGVVLNKELMLTFGQRYGANLFQQSCSLAHLVEGIQDAALRELNLDLAKAYEQGRALPPPESLELAVQHHFAAGTGERLVPLLCACAQKLYAQGITTPIPSMFSFAMGLGLQRSGAPELGTEVAAEALLGLGEIATLCRIAEDPLRASELVVELLEIYPPSTAKSARWRAARARARALLATGRTPIAMAAIATALTEHPAAQFPVGHATLLGEQARFYHSHGQFREAIDFYRGALTELGSAPAPESDDVLERSNLLTTLYYQLGDSYTELGQYDLGQESLGLALQTARGGGLARAEIRTLRQLSALARKLKQADVAAARMGEAQALAEAALDPWLLAEIYSERHRQYLRADPAVAADLLQRSFQCAQVSGRRSLAEAARLELDDGLRIVDKEAEVYFHAKPGVDF